jgi:signal transduction histidine kinase
MSQGNLTLLFPGDNEFSRLMRGLDWSTTDLGVPERWPEHLRTAARLCLTSRLAIVLHWGRRFTTLYNDSYASFLRPDKHPRALGGPGRECWGEIWTTIGPMLENVYATQKASEDVLMFLARHLPREEAYVRVTASPLMAAEGHVDGIFCTCMEITDAVVNRRRLETLRSLVWKPSKPRSVERTCEHAAAVLVENRYDIPFAGIYLTDASGAAATLKASTMLSDCVPWLPASVPLEHDDSSPWPMASVYRTRTPTEVADLKALGLPSTPGVRSESPSRAIVLPIPAIVHDAPAGFLVAGVSPLRVLDDAYRSFLDLVARDIGTIVADANAHEHPRHGRDPSQEVRGERRSSFRASRTRRVQPLPEASSNGPIALDGALTGRNGLGEVTRARVLVADDKPDMRTHLTRLLSERFEVKAVANGEAALTAMGEFRPDLIISDVVMPGLDGLSLLKHVRANPETVRLPVILLSAGAGEEWRLEALSQGADDYLVKPFSAKELMARATAHVEAMHLRTQASTTSKQRAEISSDFASRKRAADALDRLDRLKDAFLASLSHELHTPLNEVVGWTKMLLDGTVTEGLHRRMLEHIYSHARAQEQLIADLLDLSNIIQGQLRLEVKLLRAMDVVRAALDSIQSPAQVKRIVLEAAGDENTELVADDERLRQILWNLLSNAVKFTPEGGRVLISVGASDHTVIFEVQDTGIGIEEHALPRIFERLWESDSSLARARQGLGLALVRHLAELHGGAVAVVSDGLEKGSRFIVALPTFADPPRPCQTS